MFYLASLAPLGAVHKQRGRIVTPLIFRLRERLNLPPRFPIEETWLLSA